MGRRFPIFDGLLRLCFDSVSGVIDQIGRGVLVSPLRRSHLGRLLTHLHGEEILVEGV